MNDLPKKTALAATVLEVLKERSPMTTSEINEAVIKRLQIPAELLEIEDTNCIGSEYNYRMRWARTELKQKGRIKSPGRGIWEIVSD